MAFPGLPETSKMEIFASIVHHSKWAYFRGGLCTSLGRVNGILRYVFYFSTYPVRGANVWYGKCTQKRIPNLVEYLRWSFLRK